MRTQLRADMTSSEPKIRKSVISGRELFACDDMVEPQMVQTIGALVRTLHYIRKEKSRPGVPGLAAVSDIPMERIAADPFLRGLKQTVERLFPAERFTDQRAYVNCSVYGDGYYVHRDCAAHEAHVTALYYANLEWKPDWGGETIYYNDHEDAELAITPRPGRLVIARGALLHRGNVPTRACHEERYTLAYKLNSLGAWSS
jgi:SM-20-related protein